MGRKNNIVEFRRDNAFRKQARPAKWRRARWPVRRRQQKLFAILCVAVLVIPFAALQVENPFTDQAGNHSVSDTSGPRAVISWVDGDSGRINGQRFRLHGVDAPEGSPSRAQCDRERMLADDARYAVRTLTMGKRTVIRRSYGLDGYGRELVDLSVDGQDVAQNLLARGHLKRWDYPREARPDWCS